MGSEDGGVRQAEIATDILRSIKRFRHLRLSLLEAEILARLIDGRRTSNELVYQIYGLDKSPRNHPAEYYKVRRAIRNLENRGLISAPLFSKEKPYRLTRHGIASIAMIGGDKYEAPRIVPRKDLTLYATSMGLALGTAVASKSLGPENPISSNLGGIFILFVGASLVRLAETMMRVM